ncbi:glutaredoxin-like protein NrdH [Vagococcus xieshaowenii]|uniref:Glutaredoxin-like protein NrdH n=1 Tax=Vagococcus xieshaowenii TaxID=2562451 RepID=A0AAJ5EE56_9ENTE|nr:glutaredoxin-like protein NrdH [Vagococcus xieshaowenii]QCA29103.1 glutaredoxin-like protein NrdH [Vagococcus xieshaowenii]TFZ40921.1 glutaredoxin-like protein NrdH [Vagococcus xieshaowenii]
MNELTLYTKNNCPQCKMTKRFLSEKHLSYNEINIDEQPQYVDWLKEQGHRSVPVLTNSAVTIVGFRPDQLRALAV